MEARKYADAFSIHPTFSLVRENRNEYDVEAKCTREAQTDALRAENAKLAAERDARERAKESEREKTHGPRVRFEMIDGLRADDVDREIFRGRRAGDIGHRTVAFYLADCADRGLYQELGHSNAITYAMKRHHLSRRSARELIAAGRALRELAKVDLAFAKGELTWSAARAIARVADLSTEDQWIAFARSRSIEDLEREVARAKRGEKPREDRRGLSEVRFDVRLRVNALLHEQYLLARQKLGADVGRDVTDEEFAGAVLESFLRKPGEGNQSSDSLHRVVLDFRPAEGKVTLRSEDGPIDLDAARAEAICCDAGIVSEAGAPHGGHAPPISEGVRKRILTRDQWRCRVCQRGFQVEVHHIVFRSEHGSNEWANLMALCSDCHTLVHGGYLTITGRAPDRLECRNRHGELLEDPLRVVTEGNRPSLEIVPAPPPPASPTLEVAGASAPPNSGFAAEKPAMAATLPRAQAGPDWLPRHKHLIVPEAGRTALRIEPGRPLETVPEAVPGQGADAPQGADPLRPASLDDVVGQSSAVERLQTYSAAARKTGRNAMPVLLLGQSGLGKTTLAKAYARELGARLKVIDCATLEDPLTVMGYFADLRDGDAVLLDEVHALPRRVAECFYPAIENGVVHLPFVDGVAIRMIACALPKVAWLAATTNPECVAAPFRNRFSEVELAPYSSDDLTEIILRVAKRDAFEVSTDAAAVLARASSGRARMAVRLYVEVRTRVEARGASSATDVDAREALRVLQLDENGLGPVHHRILEVLRKHRRPLALPRLAGQVGITAAAFRSIYEPALFCAGEISCTRFGIGLP